MPRRNARSRTRTWLITAVAAGLALAAGTANAAPAGTVSPLRGPVVRTIGGAVRGARAGAVEEFLGIPYAAAPTGALRWHAPQPAAPWTGIKDATAYGDHCAQPASPFGVAGTSEDCLNLNVFTPASGAGHLLPVMVWIHGGANVVGESGDYDPTPLVRDGVIVVTINYRLGALGFLADPALSGPSGASGDYGLMDQQAALRWVQNNIGRFGGDRRDVTLFGESSGGLSVLSQLASPQAKGLFSKAIIESGGYDLNTATLATAQSAGEQFAAKTGCADEPTTAQTASCLRNLDNRPATTGRHHGAGLDHLRPPREPQQPLRRVPVAALQRLQPTDPVPDRTPAPDRDDLRRPTRLCLLDPAIPVTQEIAVVFAEKVT
jgi:para-nitrobenzyl esterase